MRGLPRRRRHVRRPAVGAAAALAAERGVVEPPASAGAGAGRAQAGRAQAVCVAASWLMRLMRQSHAPAW
jgi:hypothetical protein